MSATDHPRDRVGDESEALELSDASGIYALAKAIRTRLSDTAEEADVAALAEAVDAHIRYELHAGSDFLLGQPLDLQLSGGEGSPPAGRRPHRGPGVASLHARVERWSTELLEEGATELEVAAALDRALEDAGAALEWSRAVGERFRTDQVSKGLGITRQALSRRRRSGSLVGLEGHETTWWPAWQFEPTSAGLVVRPVVGRLVGAFRDAMGERATEFAVASWASTANPSLGWSSPAEWVEAGKDDDLVVGAAAEDAAAMAR